MRFYNVKKDISNEKIDLYKWVKIIEYIVLIVLGLILAITGAISEGVSNAMSYALGVVLIVFGTMNIISGYLLYRSPMSQDIATGILAIGFSVVLFYNPTLLQQILSVFLITCVFCAAVMFILNGLDHLGVFKGGEKKVKISVSEFVLSGILFALAGVYLFFYLTKKGEVERIMIVIIGGLLVIFGVFCIINMIKKVRNTKEALIEQEVNKEQTYNMSNEVVNQDVKVVDLADLKKESRKKGRNRQKATHTISENEEMQALPAPNSKNDGEVEKPKE